MRYKAIIEYDGTRYYGFQRQIDSQPTVQSKIEQVLGQLTQEPVGIVGAGRTDRGVHGVGQTIAFTTNWAHGAESLQRALNAKLPKDIAISFLEVVDDSFHPRFDARSRSYRYTIYNGRTPRPLVRMHSWHVRSPLSVERMNEAASLLIGNHDFATFGQPPQGINTVRDLFIASWSQQEDFLYFDITATAFLKRMVRSIVGSLRLVGDGSWSLEEFVAAFEACDRSQCAAAAPPQGLVFQSVAY